MPEADVWCSLEGYLQSVGGDPATLSGVPTWMAITGVVLILFVSHLLVNTWKRPGPRRYPVLNLLRWRPLRRIVHWPFFPLLLQSVSLGCLLLILTAGLFGNEKHNIAPVLTWTWWWALLIFLVLGLGQFFCAICPWEAVSSLVTSLSPKSRQKRVGYERPWPRWARTVVPATLLFILLTWFELGHDVTHSASMTAVMAMIMVSLAVLSALFFEKRIFCRSICLVGRITGLYALFSPVELRRQSAEACLSCTSKACYHGTETTAPCPTNLFPGALRENTHCTLCTECIRSCPHDNLGLQLRPPAMDLVHKTRFQWDESLLAIVLLSLTSFHGFTMTPLWTHWNQWLRAETGLGPTTVFTFLMAAMILAPMLLFAGAALLAARLAQPGRQGPRSSGRASSRWTWAGMKAIGSTRVLRFSAMAVAASGKGPSLAWGNPRLATAWRIFKAFAYSLIPVALFYHLAHNCMHFFIEAGSLIPLLSDPFGWGWNLFGTADKAYGPLLSLQTIWVLQMACIVVGHIYGVIVADRIARRLFDEPGAALRSLIPLLVTMVLYSGFSVWLIAQPMDMRTAM